MKNSLNKEKIKLGFKNPERKNKAYYELRPTEEIERIWLQNYTR